MAKHESKSLCRCSHAWAQTSAVIHAMKLGVGHLEQHTQKTSHQPNPLQAIFPEICNTDSTPTHSLCCPTPTLPLMSGVMLLCDGLPESSPTKLLLLTKTVHAPGDQLSLPPCEHIDKWVTMSSVERSFYDRLHKQVISTQMQHQASQSRRRNATSSRNPTR